MGSEACYLLRVNAANWGECYEPVAALNEIYNDKTRADGLSAWRVRSEADRRTALSILIANRHNPLKPAQVSVVEVHEDRLRELALLPEHTPHGARTSHPDGRRMHHDFNLATVQVEQAERVRNAIQEAALNGLRHCGKSDLVEALRDNIERFEDEAVRRKLRDALAR